MFYYYYVFLVKKCFIYISDIVIKIIIFYIIEVLNTIQLIELKLVTNLNYKVNIYSLIISKLFSHILL